MRKRDMKALDINTVTWEDLVLNCSCWRITLHTQLQATDQKLMENAAQKRACEQDSATNIPTHRQTNNNIQM